MDYVRVGELVEVEVEVEAATVRDTELGEGG